MMKYRIAGAMFAVGVSMTPLLAQAQTWTEVTDAEIRRLIEAENGIVTSVLPPEDNTVVLHAKMDGWLNIAVAGEDCVQTNARLRCPSLSFNAIFETNDAARATALERELDYAYVADMADGTDYIIHRQIEMRGGAGFANLRYQLSGFIHVAELISDRIWPPEGAAATPASSTPKPRRPSP
jgi:hypothetical protein